MAIVTTISAGEKSKYRGAHHWEKNRILNVVPETTFATATINQSSFAFPLSEITVDNTSADWLNVENGMMYFVGSTAGAYDVTIGVVRKTPTATVFYPDAKSRGDTGYPMGTKGITKPFADNYFITVLKYYPMFGELSLLDATTDDGEFFKFYDLSWSGQTRNLDPVANIGAWGAGYVDANTGLFTITRSFENSFAHLSNTISSYLWDLDGGSTDDSLTDETITMKFTEGFYIVKGTATDTAGLTHTARIYVWANTRSGANMPFSDKYAIDGMRIRADRRGGTLRFTADGVGHLADIFPNTAVFYTETPMTDGGELTDSRQFKSFAGYLEGYDHDREKSAETSAFNVSSPMKRAQKIVCAQQYITEKPAPSDWSQIVRADAKTALDYLLRWHDPALLENHDFIIDGDLTKYRKKSYVFNQEGLGAQITALEQFALLNVGSLDDGTTLVCEIPTYMNNADRNALGNRFDWTRDDYGTPETTKVDGHASVGYATGIAWVYDGVNADGYKAGSAGRIQGQANQKPNMETMVVPSSRADYNPKVNANLPYGQYRVMEIAGHHYAYMNRPVKTISTRPVGNYDFSHPADLREWDVFADWESIIPDGQDFARALPVSLTRTWRDGVKTLDIDFEPESFGLLGIPLPLDRGGALAFLTPDFWLLDIGELFDPTFDPYTLDDSDFGLLVAWNDNGVLARTRNALGSVPHWERITGYNGKVSDASWDYFTNRIDFTTWDNDTLTARVYSFNFVSSDSYAVTALREWEISDTTFDGRLPIDSNTATPNSEIVAYKTETAVYAIRQLTGLWSDASVETVVSIGSGDDEHVITDFDVAEIDNEFYVSVQTSDGNWNWYRADGSGSWAIVADQVGDTGTSRNSTPFLHGLASNNIVGSINLINTTANVSTDVSLSVTETFPENAQVSQSSSDTIATTFQTPYRYGYFFKTETAESINGDVAEVSRVAVTIRFQTYYEWEEGDPAGSPDVRFPPNQGIHYPLARYQIDYKFVLIIRDDNDVILATVEVTSNSFASPVTVAYLPSISLLDHIRVYKDETLEWTPSGNERVASVEVQLLETSERDSFSSDGGGFYRDLAPSVFRSYHSLSISSAVYDRENEIVDGWKLYEVTNADNVNPTWADRTHRDYVPMTRDAMGIDPNDSDNWVIVGTSAKEGKKKLLYTDNAGGSWTDVGETEYNGAKRSGNGIIAWGRNALDLSQDLMTTKQSRLGDWSASVGNVGTIRGVLANFGND